LTIFLFESAIIGILGGVIGLGIAALAAYTLTPVLMGVPGNLPMEWAGIGIGISLAIGLISGLYPALRASRMDPVQALRTE
jgi:putative ABC transport system permease protein